MAEPVMSVADLEAYVAEIFPERADHFRIEVLGPMVSRIRAPVAAADLRPGGTVSGPTVFAIADCAFYYALLAMVGREAMAVTSSLSLNFLRRPPAAADLIAEARILRLGRTLVTGDVTIFSEGVTEPVAHAAVTYARPPGSASER